MARDIDVNIDELRRFIEILGVFQRQVHDEFQELQAKWKKCDESWQGESKERFTKEFEETANSTGIALEAGDDAKKWLERFLEIVEEFERN